MKLCNKPSELIFVVLIFLTATRPSMCMCTACTNTCTVHAPWIGHVLLDRVLVYCPMSLLPSEPLIGFLLTAKLSHSCSNSSDTAVLDYSRLLLGREREIRTSLSSGDKLHFFVSFSKDVWSNCTGQGALAVEHAISWLTV